MLVEGLACHTWLDDAIEVIRMDRKNTVHVAEIDGHSAPGRIDVAFEGGTSAERNDRHTLRRANTHDRLDIGFALRKYDRIRRLVGNPARRIAVLLPHG